MADIWDIIERLSADYASFFASVPHYTDGYRRMFRTPNLAWNEPKIAQFDPKRFRELAQRLGEAKCAALLCRRGEWEEEIPPPWKRVFGRPESREKALWIIANRSMQAYAENHTEFGDIRKLPIYDDHEITPVSKFHVILVGLPTALYYRAFSFRTSFNSGPDTCRRCSGSPGRAGATSGSENSSCCF